MSSWGFGELFIEGVVDWLAGEVVGALAAVVVVEL